MKKFIIPIMFSGICLLSSCEVTVGDEKKEGTEKKIENGFSYGKKEVTINGLDKVVNGKITASEYLIFDFIDVKNATLKDGFQHVGISVVIKDSEGEILDQSDDLLSNIEQQNPKLDNFNASYGIPSRLIGQEITIEYSLFDKYGSVKYDFKETFEIVNQAAPVTKGMKFDSNIEGLKIIGQLINDKFQYEKTPARLEIGDQVFMYINGVTGFKLIENEIQSHFKLWFTNNDGEIFNEVTSELNGEVGFLDFYPIYFSKEFGDLDAGKYTWHVLIEDDNSDKFVSCECSIIIE